MKSRFKAIRPALPLAVLAALAGSAQAAVRAPLPAEQYQGSVRYVSGGIGRDEAQAFEREMSRHPVAIELLERAGSAEEYTADARVTIVDADGRAVLDTNAPGPFLLVDLAPGRYSITATLKQRTLTKHALVVTHNQLARATFEFPPLTDD